MPGWVEQQGRPLRWPLRCLSHPAAPPVAHYSLPSPLLPPHFCAQRLHYRAARHASQLAAAAQRVAADEPVQETGGKEVPRARGVNHLPSAGVGWGLGWGLEADLVARQRKSDGWVHALYALEQGRRDKAPL